MTVDRREGMLRKNQKLIGVVILLFILLWWFRAETGTEQLNENKLTLHVNKFSNKVIKYSNIQKLCYDNTGPKKLKDLYSYVLMLKRSKNLLCKLQYNLFASIYHLRQKHTTITLSASLKSVIKKSYNVDDTLAATSKDQPLLFVDNLYTLRGVVFNLLRVDIPDVWGNVSEHVRYYVEKSKPGCDFCAATTNTASDTFGRIENSHAVIVSNAFKIAKYHGLAVLKQHHPLVWSQLQFIGTVDLIMKWFKVVMQNSPGDLYQLVHWELLLRAGCSQIHPHLHLITDNHAYYAKWHRLHKSALSFSKKHNGLNYWTRLLQVYSALGLSVSFGNASLMAYLTPVQDYEVYIISDKPCLDFFRLVYFTIRTFIEEFNEPTISMGWVFPKRDSDTQSGDELPMLYRLVGRSDASSMRDDIGSSDLYGTSLINKDPYKVIEVIRESVERRAKEKFEYPEWTH